MISSLLHLVGLRPRDYYTLTNFRGGGGKASLAPPLNTPMGGGIFFSFGLALSYQFILYFLSFWGLEGVWKGVGGGLGSFSPCGIFFAMVGLSLHIRHFSLCGGGAGRIILLICNCLPLHKCLQAPVCWCVCVWSLE